MLLIAIFSIFINTAHANTLQDVVNKATTSISKEPMFANKWKQFEVLKAQLIATSSQDIDVVLYKNNMLEIFTVFSKTELSKNNCNKVIENINMKFKVDMRSYYDTTEYYKDALKILEAFCK